MSPIESKTFTGHVPANTPRGYLNIPFNVPEHTRRIDIAYICTPDLSDQRPGENPVDFIADLEVFDAGGAGFMGEGFRGTSGNSRSSIFIATDEATPGYTAGAIPAGEWTIVLGFFRFGPAGCGYEVNVTLTPGDSTPAEPLALLPLRTWSDHPINPSGWYKGELHCHTFHSDGAAAPLDVLAKAEALGLDFLAVTDHNVFTQQVDLNRAETEVILIPGCEVTTSQGHWNIWGDPRAGWIEFRGSDREQMEATIIDAKKKGYLTSCNHPRPNGPPWRIPEVEGYQCVEVWNGGWEILNDVCLEFWERQARAGKRLPLVGGSDCHNPESSGGHRLAHPTNFIYLGAGEPSAARLLDGIRAGHLFVSRAPDGPQLYLTSGSALMGDSVNASADGTVAIRVQVIGGAGMQLEVVTADGVQATAALHDADVTLDFAVKARLYVRVQLRDLTTGYTTALTNPISVEA